MWMLLEKIKGNENVVNVKRINAHEAHTWIGMVHISKMCDPMVYFYFQSILRVCVRQMMILFTDIRCLPSRQIEY